MARKILLADDSVTAQNMGRKILADAGYEVHTVNNGSAALKKIAELKPDLVVLDVYMPGYSGLEVCQRLKESQETARTPVLLTVGKLEPFKPEEAKRVRAEGFIVKPFEASELLGALAKLEDKIVPRPESKSKPGRFARANAAVEESNRSPREEPTDENLGWKNRIAFPSKKKDTTPHEEDAPAVRHAGKRDWQAVAGEDRPAAGASPAGTANTEESQVVVAALAAPGVPGTVSPEEIAAIAAAASQVESAIASAKESAQESSQESGWPPEGRVAEAKVSDEKFGASPKPAENEPAQTRPRDADVIVAIAGLEPANGGTWAPHDSAAGKVDASDEHSSDEHSSDEHSPDGHPLDGQAGVPATMAGGPAMENSSGDSRWVAIPVALEAADASTSLNLEMQKAYAAFAAAEANLPGFVSSPPAFEPVEPSSQGTSWASTDATTAADPALKQDPELANTVGAIADATAEAVTAAAEKLADVAESHVEPEAPLQAVGAVSAEGQPVAETPTIQNDLSPDAAIPDSAQSDVPNQNARSRNSLDQDSPNQDSLNQDSLNQVPFNSEPPNDELQIPATFVPVAAVSTEASQFAAQPFSVVTGTGAGTGEPGAEATGDMTQQKESAQKESARTATTAAAWANWREIRNSDPRKEGEREEDESTPPTDSAAMAVAAGAERSPVVPAAAAAAEDPQALANIVDSVMAELRPKIMEEISRKMKKKQ